MFWRFALFCRHYTTRMVITRVLWIQALANTTTGCSVHFTAACCSGLRSKKRAMRHPKEEPRINAMRDGTQCPVTSKFSIPTANGHELTRMKTSTADGRRLTRMKTSDDREWTRIGITTERGKRLVIRH